MVPSLLADASREPSGEKAMAWTDCRWPANVATSAAGLRISHTRTAPTQSDAASCLPFGLNARDATPAGSAMVNATWRVARSHTRMTDGLVEVVPLVAYARNAPFELSAMASWKVPPAA